LYFIGGPFAGIIAAIFDLDVDPLLVIPVYMTIALYAIGRLFILFETDLVFKRYRDNHRSML
jgi:hypothetical protein